MQAPLRRSAAPIAPRRSAAHLLQSAAPTRAASRRRLICRNMTGIDSFVGFSSLMNPEVATIFSAIIAVSSVGLNLYGNLLREKSRVDLQRELEAERMLQQQSAELQSVISRYRGPLLEATVDLEQRLYHLITATDEWRLASCENQLCAEEVLYTMFTMAQFLGFVEVVRREGPRDFAFISVGDPLTTLLESFRFALAATPSTLQDWYDKSHPTRDHPGARQRSMPGDGATPMPSGPATALPPSALARAGAVVGALGVEDASNGSGASGNGSNVSSGRDEACGLGLTLASANLPPYMLGRHLLKVNYFNNECGQEIMSRDYIPFRISRGFQRAIGSAMIVTPMGAPRHYTLSYSQFVDRMNNDPSFYGWLLQLHQDIVSLLQPPHWAGGAAFPAGRWTRLLLLQALLVDTIELLDPDCMRVAASRRVKLSPIDHAPLPNTERYTSKLRDSGVAVGLAPGAMGTILLTPANSATSANVAAIDED